MALSSHTLHMPNGNVLFGFLIGGDEASKEEFGCLHALLMHPAADSSVSPSPLIAIAAVLLIDDDDEAVDDDEADAGDVDADLFTALVVCC